MQNMNKELFFQPQGHSVGVGRVYEAQKAEKSAVRPGEGAWVPPGHPREGLDRRQNYSR